MMDASAVTNLRDIESRSAAAGSTAVSPNPRVSVVMPCYNGEAFVAEAIRSALDQTYAHIELVIVDDASTDGSAEIINNAADRDRRVKPVFLRKNLGPAHARNEGLAVATGDWITLLDADDLYEPDRIERLLALARVTHAEAVVDNQTVWDYPLGQNGRTAFDFLCGTLPVPISQDLFFENSGIIGRMDPGYMKPMFRREFLRKKSIAYRPQYRVGEDFLFYAECLFHSASFYGTSYPGYIYRRRQSSLSNSGGWALRSLAAMSSEIIDRYDPLLTPRARAALLRRQRVYDRFARLAELRKRVAERGLRRSWRALAASPDLLLLAPGILRKRLMRA